MSRRPYLRKIKRRWWLGQRRYLIYMVRELTACSSAFIAHSWWSGFGA